MPLGLRALMLSLASFGIATTLAAQEPATPAAPANSRAMTLEDLYADPAIADISLSPSGKYFAAALRRDQADLLAIGELGTTNVKAIQSIPADGAGKSLEMRITSVYWKSDDRLLFRLSIFPAEGRRTFSNAVISKLGDRLFAIDRDGGRLVRLLAGNNQIALEGVFDLASIASFLPRDPAHILMVLKGYNGRSLFRVNLETGMGTQVERPDPSVVGWWLDMDGTPMVRIAASHGSVRLYRREGDKWEKFHSMRVREMRERPEYDFVGPSDQRDKLYVLARVPGRDRVALHLYDYQKNEFGEPLAEHAKYDLDSARVSRDGKSVTFTCHMEDVRVCEFTDREMDAQMRGIRKFFQQSANVYVQESSDDGKTLLLYVEGPRDPPGYYYYLANERRIESIGAVSEKLMQVTLPVARAVEYATRDGLALTGYLTTPANVPEKTRLPLVVMPHGGPERRDRLTFDPWVQYLVARGYAVFQPNFRGSGGFGQAFAESGYGQWGRKMQDDISDGVKALVDQGVADPARLCIVGSSYGGYAALAGAAFTPDLYRCAVAIAAVTDLDDFISWRRRNWGRDSEGYTYWLKAIGDPEREAERIREVSPVEQAAKIRIPVLLIHGTDDWVVPLQQSKMMKRALEKSGRKTELLEIREEGHSYWDDDNEKLALTRIGEFLLQHIGPGFGTP